MLNITLLTDKQEKLVVTGACKQSYGGNKWPMMNVKKTKRAVISKNAGKEPVPD